MKDLLLFTLVGLCSLLSLPTYAATFTAVASADWSVGSTWDQGSVPTASDDVIIDGYSVTITGDVSVNSITITNVSGTGNTNLYINSDVTVTIANDFIAKAYDQADNVIIEAGNSASSPVISVGRDLWLERTSDNYSNRALKMHLLGNVTVSVTGDFKFNYYGSNPAESQYEVYMEGNASLTVDGYTSFEKTSGAELSFVMVGASTATFNEDFTFNVSGGQDCTFTSGSSGNVQFNSNVSLNKSGGSSSELLFESANGQMNIGGNLNAASSGNGMDLKIRSTGASTNLSVEQNINLTAASDNTLGIEIILGGTLNVGGNISRLSNYGYLTMDTSSYLNLRGTTGTQMMPEADVANSGTDEFNFTNISFNSSADSIVLSGPLEVSRNLTLTKGVIYTDDTNTLTLLDGATISGGSSTAYIDGPIIKIGSTGGSSLLLPIGYKGTYAPIEMSAVSNSTAQYTARYLGCPPPLLNTMNAPLTHIISNGFWNFERTSGSPAVSITLHWDDAGMYGINDTTSLVVASYNSATGWYSQGKGAATQIGITGSVTNDFGCPPPIENTKLTLGSIDEDVNKLLPVEITRFSAQSNQNKVFLDWVTSSETNSSHFEIQKSKNGEDFEPLATILAQGESTSSNNYQTIDVDPFEGLNYYRLKQYDNDGTFEYSYIVAVIMEVYEAPMLYPNPVRDRFKVSGGIYSDRTTTVEIFDQNGQRLYLGELPMLEGNMEMNVNQLNIERPGTYFLRFQNSSGTHLLRFIKQ